MNWIKIFIVFDMNYKKKYYEETESFFSVISIFVCNYVFFRRNLKA